MRKLSASNVTLALVLILLLGASLPQGLAAGGRTLIYVDRDATDGKNDGTSWADAYTTLQAALDAVNGDGTTFYEIWVAAGVYYPDEGPLHTNDDVSETFRILRDNVILYGGFAGTETVRHQRDWIAYPTILSGDIDGNDSVDATGVVTDAVAINGYNAWHVLYLDGVTEQPITPDTLIDGFTITGGSARDLSGVQIRGGGLYCRGNGTGNGCSPVLTHVIFSGNRATHGGGLYVDGSSGGVSSPTLTGVTFTGNQASYGGGMYSQGAYGNSSPVLTDVVFSGNRAIHIEGHAEAGGMFHYGTGGTSHPVLTNVTFAGNWADATGGGMMIHNDGAELVGRGTHAAADTHNATLTNVLFSGNGADEGGALFNYDTDHTRGPALTNVTFAGNRANRGGAISNLVGDGLLSLDLRNCILWGNSASTFNEIFDPDSSATLVYSNIDQGGYAGIQGNIRQDPQFVAPIDASHVPTTTGSYRLQLTSPAIDAGDTVSVTATTDLDGAPRLSDMPGVPDTGTGTAPVVDMGAYEAHGNLAPFFTSTPNTLAMEDTGYTYIVRTGDYDLVSGDVLTLTAPTLPGWLVLIPLDTTSIRLSGTPGGDAIGVHDVVLRVEDGSGAFATQAFKILVDEKPPVKVYVPLILRVAPSSQ